MSSTLHVLRMKLTVARVELEKIGWVTTFEMPTILVVCDADDYGPVLRITAAPGNEDDEDAGTQEGSTS